MDTKSVWGYLDLIKTFWNLAWFGGWKNLFKQVDTQTSNLFSPKLQLTEKEMTLAKISYPGFSLDSLLDQVNKFFRTVPILSCYCTWLRDHLYNQSVLIFHTQHPKVFST
jgi:hypothetical protein